MDSIIVCPFCHKEFREKQEQNSKSECPACKEQNSKSECPACKESFCRDDWRPDDAHPVYSPKNRHPKLFLEWDGNEWSPSPHTTEFYLGWEPDPDGLQLVKTPEVSRKHARIRLIDGVWYVDSLEKNDGRKTVVRLIKADSDRDSSDILSETPLSTKDIIKIGPFQMEVTVDCSPEYIFDATKGEIENPQDAYFLNQNDPLYIGSDKNECKVVINGAAPVHAMIYYQEKTNSWWIADCNSTPLHGRPVFGTKVNGLQILNEKLEDLDRITIAGIDFLLDGNAIRVGNGEVLGVDVLVKDVSVAKKGKDILKEISFSAEPGEFIGILGPSGCGKSSLIQRLVGLGGFDHGEVRINSILYKDHKDDIQSITSYIPQDVALHDNLTLKDEMDVFCKLHLGPEKKNENDNEKKRKEDVLKLVHLEGKETNRIGDMSGGEKRRFSIALELLRKPYLFCLDEPTSGLDPATETDIMTLLRRIANQGRTVLCSTHVMENIRLFDKVLFLARGRMLFFGTPSDLLKHFNASSLLQLYRQFGRGTKDEQIERAKKESARYHKKDREHEPKCQTLPSPFSQAGVLHQVNGYLLRQFYDFISFRNGKDNKDILREGLSSAAFIQMILQPILVAYVLKLACAFYFVDANEHKKLYFFFSIAVFWLGLNGAIRELVKERVPWRCLERLSHVPMFSYLFSKVIWVQLLCAVQVAIFSVCIFLPRFAIYSEIAGGTPVHDASVLTFMWITFFTLYLICSLGAWIALAVSAAFKKENAAVGLLPIILIPVLFFSHPIITDNTIDDDFFPKYEKSNGQFSKTATDIERFMPGFAPEVLLDRAETRAYMIKTGQKPPEKQLKPWLIFFGMLSSYMAIAMGLMILFQGRNENQWEGR